MTECGPPYPSSVGVHVRFAQHSFATLRAKGAATDGWEKEGFFGAPRAPQNDGMGIASSLRLGSQGKPFDELRSSQGRQDDERGAWLSLARLGSKRWM